MKRNWITRACLFVGLALLSNAAVAAIQDATILIDRAINSPTLTVKFSGVTVALVELRVNGVSVGTRSVGNLKSGETNFTLDLASLRDGDNEIEIRLFDKGGKLVGRERTLIATDDGTHSAVFLRAPKMGATVQGPVEIQIGFGRTMRNAYVSFFIDNQFKSMTNVQPFSYIWDTQREANGWHELEAWVVDDDSNTHKTRKIRVFVNNPGGRTFRNPAPVKPEPKTPLVLEPAANPGRTSAGGEKGLKSAVGAPGSLEPGVKHAAPRASGLTSANSLKSVTGSESGVKANPLQPGIAAGAKSLTPTGTRVASNKLAEPKASIVPTAKAAALTPVKKGAKLPNGPYSVMVNDEYVKFDVQPRVENGVPLTPFRHLIEHSGGEVKWDHKAKTVKAQADGKQILIQIGDVMAKVNGLPIQMEIAAFIEKSRTIVPLSFIQESLDVNVDYDKATGHVLITSAGKK